MKKLLYILLIATVLSSCSEYQKALKSTDVTLKYKVGEEKYKEGKFNKANKLFVQIVPKYRGKPQAQRLMYMYANTFYETRDYYTANYQFERFVTAYPESEKVVEAAFLGAKSYYFLSPLYSKEQKETVEALSKLQNFINTYPDSEYSVEANALVRELDYKLEKKAYEIAYQYNKTTPYTRDFQAAISAFDKFLLEYPGSAFREDAFYYKFDSAYQLAINSVDRKMEDRLNIAIEYYNNLLRAFPQTKYAEDALEMYEELTELLQNYNTKS